MASYRPKLEQLTTDPDGQDLDEIIGELQSVWGVPQYPQEYRITIKVAEERNGNRPRTPKPPMVTASGVQREKAPAAPRMGAGSGSESTGDAPRRKRRRRRRRGGGGSGTPPASAS